MKRYVCWPTVGGISFFAPTDTVAKKIALAICQDADVRSCQITLLQEARPGDIHVDRGKNRVVGYLYWKPKWKKEEA